MRSWQFGTHRVFAIGLGAVLWRSDKLAWRPTGSSDAWILVSSIFDAEADVMRAGKYSFRV